MDIPEFGSLQMIRTDSSHYGSTSIVSTISKVGSPTPNSAKDAIEGNRRSFEDYLVDAVRSMNNQQMDVSKMQEKLITDPDSVDIHDVTIAMGKARMSLNLTQTVIDRLVQGWNDISTTR